MNTGAYVCIMWCVCVYVYQIYSMFDVHIMNKLPDCCMCGQLRVCEQVHLCMSVCCEVYESVHVYERESSECEQVCVWVCESGVFRSSVGVSVCTRCPC